jgi:hypothetical protein
VKDGIDPQRDWVNAHMGKTSKQAAQRLLSAPQTPAPPDAPRLTLRGVKVRCVAGGASNFWIIGSEAAEPQISGDYPLTSMSPTAYFIKVPQFNDLPYAVPRERLTAQNHGINGDTSALEAQMREAYG